MPKESTYEENKLIEESTVPLYFQLMTMIKRQIDCGILKPGDMVPSESQLCSQYGVSRSTVRQALNQLAEKNLIIRRRGKGSFISNPKYQRSLNHLYSFTEDMLAMGFKPRSEILESSIINPSDDIVKQLELPNKESKVFKMTRLRIANDEALLIETSHIPLYLCPDIDKEDFSNTSLYSVLQNKYSLNLHRAFETYESIKLNKESAALLNCKSSSCAFSIQRIAYLDTGIPFELTNSIVRSDRCIFQVELYANKNKVSFSRKIIV